MSATRVIVATFKLLLPLAVFDGSGLPFSTYRPEYPAAVWNIDGSTRDADPLGRIPVGRMRMFSPGSPEEKIPKQQKLPVTRRRSWVGERKPDGTTETK
ncbi:MAG TPA: hypothetical protein VEZ19_14355, partial [Rubrobacter sp.]|nr:hypothetical protein [Rubrobacter sp.]